MEILNKEDLAAYLKVDVKTITSLLYQKKIPKIRIGKEYRFIKEDIDQWIRLKREKVLQIKFEGLS